MLLLNDIHHEINSFDTNCVNLGTHKFYVIYENQL